MDLKSRNVAGMKKILLAVSAMMTTLLASSAPIEWNSAVGPVKPVNGVGLPPMLGLPRKAYMMHYLKEAGIPYSRLHDVPPEECGGLYIAAAKDSEGRAAVMVANCEEGPKPLNVNFGLKTLSCHMTDGTFTHSEVKLPEKMPGHSFIVVKSKLK